MDTPQKSLDNYFNAAQKFMNSWMDFMTAMTPDSDKQQAEQAKASYGNLVSDIMGMAKDFSQKQVDAMANMTPEEIQGQTLSKLQEFKDDYQKATDWVMDMLQKEEDYVSSDEFVKQVQNSRELAGTAYSSSLNSFAKMFENYANFLGKLQK